MRIVLVAPEAPSYVPFSNSEVPYGLAYISSSLKAAGHEVHCLNGHHLAGVKTYDQAFYEISRNTDIDIIGTGGFSITYQTIRKILAAGRKIFPNAKSLLGGNILTCMPESIMRDMQADFGIVGEGEISSVELLRRMESGEDLREVPGAVLRDAESGEVFVSPRASFPEDLDSLPYPDLDGFGFAYDVARQASALGVGCESLKDDFKIYIVTCNRSCPFNCSFCYHPPGSKFRQRSVKNIFEEIDMVVERYGVNHIGFGGEVLFTKNNPEKIFQICAAMKERGLTWDFQIMVNAVTDEILGAMKDAGCLMISYGIESVSEKILKSMRKGTTREQIEEALALTYKHSIDIQGNLLVGDPEESWETFTETMGWWLRNRKYMLNLSRIMVCPNSALFQNAKKRKIITDEIAYINTADPGQWRIDVTKMPGGEYTKMIKKFNELVSSCFYFPGFLRRFALKEADSFGRKRYCVEAVCPHCGGESRYNSLHIQRESGPPPALDWPVTIKCRCCTRRYHLPNLGLMASQPKLPARMFGTHLPPHKLYSLYLKHGGSIDELTGAL